MSRILITGASGLLGATLALALRGDHNVYAMSFSHDVPVGGVHPVLCDLRDPGSVNALLTRVRPDAVIHAAALTDVELCESEPATAWAINVGGTESLLQACHALDGLFCYISTDYVFDGTKGGYAEKDEPGPVNVYGRTKLAAEKLVSQARFPWVIVRTSFFGWNPGSRKGFLEKAWQALQRGNSVTAWSNRFSTPLLVNGLAAMLVRVVSEGLTGIWHAASDKRVSNWELATELAEAFGFDSGLVKPAMWAPAPHNAVRPADTSLDARSLETRLGLSFGNYRDAVRYWKVLMDSGYPFAPEED